MLGQYLPTLVQRLFFAEVLPYLLVLAALNLTVHVHGVLNACIASYHSLISAVVPITAPVAAYN